MKNVPFTAKFSFSPVNTPELSAKSIKASDMSSTAAINIAHVGVHYRTQEALRDVNCIVKPGKLTGIFTQRCRQKYVDEGNVGLSSSN